MKSGFKYSNLIPDSLGFATGINYSLPWQLLKLTDAERQLDEVNTGDQSRARRAGQGEQSVLPPHLPHACCNSSTHLLYTDATEPPTRPHLHSGGLGSICHLESQADPAHSESYYHPKNRQMTRSSMHPSINGAGTTGCHSGKKRMYTHTHTHTHVTGALTDAKWAPSDSNI